MIAFLVGVAVGAVIISFGLASWVILTLKKAIDAAFDG